MIDVTSIFASATASYNAIKKTCETALNLRDVKKDFDHHSIYNKILAESSSLYSRIMDLKTVNHSLSIKLNNADREKEELLKTLRYMDKYEPSEIALGIYCLALKEDHCAEKLPRYICPECASLAKVSILQLKKQGKGEWLNCHSCGLELELKPNSSSYKL